MPLASSLNFTTGRTIANSVVAKIGSTGEVCIYTSAPTHVVVDVNGAFSPTGVGRSWRPAASRILDTRSSVKAAAGSVTELTVAGRDGVPANATAVVLNVTAVDPPGRGSSRSTRAAPRVRWRPTSTSVAVRRCPTR